MNKTESLALFDQRCDAWNAWAKERLAERRKLEASGEWSEGSDPGKWNDKTRAWQETAAADFSGHEFEDMANFSGFVFPGRAEFSKAAFKGDADFSEAAFSGDARFSEATFSGDAGFIKAAFSGTAGFSNATFSGDVRFGKATFSGLAWFREAKFKGNALFYEAKFKGNAWFDQEVTFSESAMFLQASFAGFTSFNDCLFKGGTTYRATQVSKTFLLDQARFKQVPDFIQTHFAEVPRLDNFHIKPRRFWTGRLAGIRALFKSGAGPAVFWRAGLNSVKALFKDDANLAARWRALKKLAIMAYDHNSELRFFKEEILARRWSVDKPWHALFFAGLFYGWLSDFGRSILWPLFWWALGLLGFAWCYFSQAGGRWADVLNWSLPCDAGTGNAVYAALGLSLRNALPLPGGGSAARLDQIYACLYGIHDNAAGELPARLRLVIPDAVAFSGVAQSLWSVIMIFLLLLALRNHFRIK